MTNKKIEIFDLDDTLTKTPAFPEFLGVNEGEIVDIYSSVYEKKFKEIKAAFADELSKEVSFKRSKDYIVPINTSNGKPFNSLHMDYFKDSKYSRMFEIKNDTITIVPFPDFYSNPASIGMVVNEEVKDIYDSAVNKMILTGRNDELRKQIEDNFQKIGIEYPNQGFFMFVNRPNKKKIKQAQSDGSDIFIPPYNSIKEYKLWVISQAIESQGWNEIHFYEDRQDWLSFVEGAIKSKYPEVKFVPHYISNVKDSLSL
jgi:hypothetical protein